MALELLTKQKDLIKHKNVKKYYLMTFFNSLLFGESSWIFFWSMFLSYKQIGIIDALGFGLGLLLEIPTGAIGDLIGKKKAIIISFLFTTAGVAIMTGAFGFSSMLIGFLGFQIGFALYSGTSEALAYDSLVEDKAEHKYEDVISFTNILMILTIVFATFIGGYFLYGLNPRLPYMFWGISQFMALLVALTLKEPKVVTEKFSAKNYVWQLKLGVQKMFGPKLRKYLLSILIVLGFFFIFDWGFLKPAMAVNFGFNNEVLSIVSPILYLLSALALTQLHRLRSFFGDNAGMMFLTLCIGIGMFLGSFKIGLIGFIPMLLITLAGNLGTPWLSIIINNNIESKYRATVLSTVAFLTKLPYVVFSLLIGSSMQKGELSTFALLVSIFVFACIVVSYLGGAYSHEKKSKTA